MMKNSNVHVANDDNKVSMKDIKNRADIEQIVSDFYDQVLVDPIVGFIFTNVVTINLVTHLPIIVNFWADLVLQDSTERLYHGNALQTHLKINALISLKPGHFTRWLFLFSNAIDRHYAGPKATLMKARASGIAQSISAAITDQKKSDMRLTLSSWNETSS